jgi:hypothetical protein
LCHALLADARFFSLLIEFDADIAAQVRAAGCPCGGRLHSARYRRKPRGAAIELAVEYEWRQSFCCAADGCRRRVTPPSIRYLGRRVYLGVAVIVLSAMTHGLSPRRVASLHEHLGVSVRTLRRWHQWWRAVFVTSAVWRDTGARFLPALQAAALPWAWLERLRGPCSERLQHVLWGLAPLTTQSATVEGLVVPTARG